MSLLAVSGFFVYPVQFAFRAAADVSFGFLVSFAYFFIFMFFALASQWGTVFWFRPYVFSLARFASARSRFLFLCIRFDTFCAFFVFRRECISPHTISAGQHTRSRPLKRGGLKTKRPVYNGRLCYLLPLSTIMLNIKTPCYHMTHIICSSRSSLLPVQINQSHWSFHRVYQYYKKFIVI